MTKKFVFTLIVVSIFASMLTACGTQTSMIGINASSRVENCDFGQMALIEGDFRSVATNGVLDMSVDSYLDSISSKYACIK